MKECLICGERFDDHSMQCSEGHSLFRHPRTDTYSCDTKLIEEILRQSTISDIEDEIIYLLSEITRIFNRDRTEVSKEKVEITGRNLKEDLIERKHKEQEEADRKRKEQEEVERRRKEQEEADRKRKEQEAAEHKRREQEAAERQRRYTEEAERRRKEQEEADRKRKEQEAAERRRKEQEHERRKQVEEILDRNHLGNTEDEIIYLTNETLSELNWKDVPVTEEKVIAIGNNLIQNLADRKEQDEIERNRKRKVLHRHRQEMVNMRENQLGIAELNAYRAAQFLVEHFKNSNLQKQAIADSAAPDLQFDSNQHFWSEVLAGRRIALNWIELTEFTIVDWFPRTPGLFHTSAASRARSVAEEYVIEENGIKFYNPQGKMHMIEGGTGSVRFKPLKIENEDCWLCTATSDRHCQSGIPLAIPNTIMQKIDLDSRYQYKIIGQVKFLPKFLSEDYFYHTNQIPQIYVFANEIEMLDRENLTLPVNITPMVFFKSNLEFGHGTRESRGRPQQTENVTYVTCRADSPSELDRATDWLTWYTERFQGKVITNFDEQRPAFCNAPFSLQNVMSGNLDSYQMRELRIEHADILCNTIKSIHSEETSMTQIDLKLGNGVTIHGDFVVANSIKDSFNKASSNTSDDLKYLLEELSVAVAKMSEAMPKENAIRAARALNTVIDEATSSKPSREWWQVSVDGLTKAAENIGNIGKPVLEILGKLVPVLITMSQ